MRGDYGIRMIPEMKFCSQCLCQCFTAGSSHNVINLPFNMVRLYNVSTYKAATISTHHTLSHINMSELRSTLTISWDQIRRTSSIPRLLLLLHSSCYSEMGLGVTQGPFHQARTRSFCESR
jgi:hypothetical protein